MHIFRNAQQKHTCLAGGAAPWEARPRLRWLLGPPRVGSCAAAQHDGTRHNHARSGILGGSFLQCRVLESDLLFIYLFIYYLFIYLFLYYLFLYLFLLAILSDMSSWQYMQLLDTLSYQVHYDAAPFPSLL
jgi:hypothetical protein